MVADGGPVMATTKGRKLSVEHRAKLSAAARGRKLSEATKAKIAAAGRRRRHSEATKAKQRASNLAYWAAHPERRAASGAKASASLLAYYAAVTDEEYKRARPNLVLPRKPKSPPPHAPFR